MKNDRNRADIFIAMLVIAFIIFIIAIIKNSTERVVNALSKLKTQKEKELAYLKTQARQLDKLGVQLDRKTNRIIFIIKLGLILAFVAVNTFFVQFLGWDLYETTAKLWFYIVIGYSFLCFLFSNSEITPSGMIRWMKKGIKKRLYRKYNYSPEKVLLIQAEISEKTKEIENLKEEINEKRKEFPLEDE